MASLKLKVKHLTIIDKKTPLNPSQFTQWLSALYSGKYPKCRGALQTSYGFCCLGVGCQELIKAPKRDKDSYLRGGMPVEQPDAPEWLKDISVDMSMRLGYSLSGLNDRVDDSPEVIFSGTTIPSGTFSHEEIADLLYSVYVLGVLE